MRRGKWMFLVLLAAVLAMSGFYLSSKYYPTKTNDFSRLSWTGAFNKLHSKLAKEYAFTEWKRIDWQSTYDQAIAEIKAAQAAGDVEAYYLALRTYLNEIPDGHVSLNSLPEIDDKYIGGGFGLSAARLDDGSVIAAWVDESGPAYASGMRAGALLLKWNNEPTSDAIAKVSTVFAGTSATTENLECKRAQYLTRAPVGTRVQIEYQNAGDTAPRSVTLTAYDDCRLSLKKSYPDAVVSDKVRSMLLDVDNPDPVPSAMVETRTLEGNISYIKIWGEFDADLQQSGTAPSTLSLLRRAVQEANESKAPAIILDLRNNVGGLDEMAADILGCFYNRKTLYEYQSVYNAAAGRFEVQQTDSGSDALYIEPAEPYFGGKIIALINQKCVSSGEGIAMGIRNLQNGETLGFYGTNGSFGLVGTEVKMPDGLVVRYPSGQSLNKNREIQLDSRDGVGGVAPSIRIPMTAENAIRVANGEDVELKEAVRIIGLSGAR